MQYNTVFWYPNAMLRQPSQQGTIESNDVECAVYRL